MSSWQRVFAGLGGIVLVITIVFLVIQNSNFQTRNREHPTIIIELNGREIIVETVSSTADIKQGLSDRSSMERNTGMLFELGYRGIHPFWMNRMHVPLDIIWIDGNTVVEIAERLPPPKFGEIPFTYTPKTEADRVLEVNAGVVQEIGLEIGDTVNGLTEE